METFFLMGLFPYLEHFRKFYLIKHDFSCFGIQNKCTLIKKYLFIVKYRKKYIPNSFICDTVSSSCQKFNNITSIISMKSQLLSYLNKSKAWSAFTIIIYKHA